MSLFLKILPRDLPAFIRHEIITELLDATANAFGYQAPTLDHLPYAECLRGYALFTKEQAEKAIQTGSDLQSIKNQLYQHAFPLGENLRKWLGGDTMVEVMQLGQVLYRAIGVDMQGDPEGNVIVKGCYFSHFYSSSVCDLISALDDGVFSGLSGGGRLVFSERLTEGKPFCRAKLQVREAGR